MNVFQNTNNKYHSLSISMYSQYYAKIDEHYGDVQFSYKGSFDDINLSYINQYIELAVKEETGRRTDLFRVFVELAQNIAQNSLDKLEVKDICIGCGIMIINEVDDYFEIIAGNPATNEDVKKLEEKCDKINSCSEDELRQLKREYRRMEQGEKGNANIGLIKIALIAMNALDYNIIPIDDNSSFFTLAIKLKKQ